MEIHKADARGTGEYGWLATRYSFSFANWFAPSRMGFGALRVLNDDRIAPGAGFPPHSHKDMEIITIVTEGAVAHTDSTGGAGVVRAGEVQVMSAGSGVVHSEYNASDTDPLTLFQIWIETAQQGIAPRYAQKTFSKKETATVLVTPIAFEGEALGIHQDAYITRVQLAEGETYTYTLHDALHGAYVFVISGELSVAGSLLNEKDALAISDMQDIPLVGDTMATALVIEVPLS